MSNFMKGFSQGFQPNIGSIISNIMMQGADRAYKTKTKLEERQYKENLAAEEEKRKLENKQREDSLQETIFKEITEDPIKNSHLWQFANAETRGNFEKWKSLQNRNEVREVTNDKGRFLMQYTKDWQGNILDEKPLEEKLATVRKESFTKDGKTVKYDIKSDGSKVLSQSDTDYDKIATYQKDNREKLTKFDIDIENALQTKDKVGIYGKKADINAIEGGNALLDIPTDYTERDLAQSAYDNQKATILFRMRDEVGDTAWNLIRAMDGEDPQRMKEYLNNSFVKYLEDGDITEKDLIFIGKAFRLYTGEDLR